MWHDFLVPKFFNCCCHRTIASFLFCFVYLFLLFETNYLVFHVSNLLFIVRCTVFFIILIRTVLIWNRQIINWLIRLACCKHFWIILRVLINFLVLLKIKFIDYVLMLLILFKYLLFLGNIVFWLFLDLDFTSAIICHGMRLILYFSTSLSIFIILHNHF